MSEFKWKVASFENAYDKRYAKRLLDTLDNQLEIVGEACRFGEVDSISVNYANGVTLKYEIHRKEELV